MNLRSGTKRYATHAPTLAHDNGRQKGRTRAGTGGRNERNVGVEMCSNSNAVIDNSIEHYTYYIYSKEENYIS